MISEDVHRGFRVPFCQSEKRDRGERVKRERRDVRGDMILAETSSIEFVEIVLHVDQAIDSLSLHQGIVSDLFVRVDIDRCRNTQIEKMLNIHPFASAVLLDVSYRVEISVST